MSNQITNKRCVPLRVSICLLIVVVVACETNVLKLLPSCLVRELIMYNQLIIYNKEQILELQIINCDAWI